MNLMGQTGTADFYFFAEGRGEDALGFMETLVCRLFQFIGGNDHKKVISRGYVSFLIAAKA